MIYIGADHRGFKLKEEIKKWLTDWKIEFDDMGAYEHNPEDDYTLYAEKVASVVSSSFVKAPEDKAILLCGSGVGVDVMANKFDNVRSSIGKNKEQVHAGRNDDDMNVLVIASDYTKVEEAKEMVKTFLDTKFSGKDRYKRRIEEIERVEENRQND